ncbi:phosphotransferase [Tatlockia micdadei]|nr:phosphotransferase [Legionella micdadei]NSL17140.1 phosphotransferase [Legionella micdadei]
MFVVQELLRSLADLEKEGLRHNDLRTWNVLYDKEQVSLIDYGFVSHKELGNDAISLLWLLNAVLTGEREGYDVNKKELPKKKAFEQAPSLQALYEAVESGEYSPIKLQAVINEVNNKTNSMVINECVTE